MFFIYVILSLISLPIIYELHKLWKLREEYGTRLYYSSNNRLDGKTVLITGGNSGLGYATAIQLADRGARIILACRDLNRAVKAAQEITKETGNKNIRTMQLDLIDLNSVRRLARQVIRNEQRLDILINNAGIAKADVPTTKQGYDTIFGTNYLGSFLLTNLLLGLLRQSAPSRIINVSSFLHKRVTAKPSMYPGSKIDKIKYPILCGYPLSKLCNILHTKALTAKLWGTNVTANSMDPGIVDTKILGKNNGIMSYIIFKLVRLISRSAKDAAKTIVYMALDDSLHNVSGHYFQNVRIASDQLSNLAKNKDLIHQLWDLSEKMCCE